MPEYDDYRLCICGHPAYDHHQTWLWGGHFFEECEHYGFDESGGMMPSGLFVVDSTGRAYEQWVDHCQHFTPVAIPLPPIKTIEIIVWQHQAQGVGGDYQVDPAYHAHDSDRCPLCQ